MRHAFSAIVLFSTLCAAGAAVAWADQPKPGQPLAINASGTFVDKGVWLYRGADGKYGYGPATNGTNELLVMPSPSPPAGGAVAGVEIIRHPLDTLGYPLHIALVEKLFGASLQIPVIASNNGDLWKYEYGDPVANETAISTGKSTSAFKVWGPFHADAIPFAQAPEREIAPAFDFAKNALNSIGNRPASQKDPANYGVLFLDDGNTVWVEFGPRFGPNEAPHLGCQTQLGRDMVFGYDKKQTTSGATGGKFVQCF